MAPGVGTVTGLAAVAVQGSVGAGGGTTLGAVCRAPGRRPLDGQHVPPPAAVAAAVESGSGLAAHHGTGTGTGTGGRVVAVVAVDGPPARGVTAEAVVGTGPGAGRSHPGGSLGGDAGRRRLVGSGGHQSGRPGPMGAAPAAGAQEGASLRGGCTLPPCCPAAPPPRVACGRWERAGAACCMYAWGACVSMRACVWAGARWRLWCTAEGWAGW